MNTIAKYFTLIFVLFLPSLLKSQELKRCGTDEAEKLIFDKHPELLQDYLNREEMYRQIDLKEAKNNYANARTSSAVLIVPVVFHIIHMYGPENLTDAKVQEAIDVMNEDFRKQNADTAQTIPAFQSLMADCEIEFRLATIDPNGNCTNGIERFYSPQTNNGGEDAKFNQWPQNKYLNIWVVKKMGPDHLSAAAYSYLPGNAPSGGDGIICLYDYVGTNQGNSHTLSHEAGHWLNLRHTWGSTNQPNVACGDDNVSDTPITKGSNLFCNLNMASCNPPTLENVQNFMDYSFCTTMFTIGQKTRMRNALSSTTAGRSNLWTASNLAATGTNTAPTLCAAAFKSNNFYNVVCQNGLVTFTDISYNAHASSRLWTFPGGVLSPPSQATDSIITIQYPNPGQFDVGLTVSNGVSNFNETKLQYINVVSSVAAYNAGFYTESFETTSLPSNDWEVISPDNGNVTWIQNLATGSSGTASAAIENTIADSADVDDLVSPTINVQASGSNYMYFKYAFRKKKSTNNDAMKIYFSTDCGKTWILRRTINATTLSTVATASTQYFIPTSAQWKLDSINMATMLGQTNFRIKFQFIAGGGNNFYLDDINLPGTTGLTSITNNASEFTIFPNPAKESCTLSFYMKSKGKANLVVSDILGKEILHPVSNETLLDEGQHKIEIGKGNKLPSGIYLVKFQTNGQTSIKKLVID